MQTPVKSPKSGAVLNFLYGSTVGRVMLKVLTLNTVSVIVGKFMDCGISKILIKPFVKSKNIDLSIYEDKKYRSFNDFFTRQIQQKHRPFNMDENVLASPCDGLLSAYKIADGIVVPAKQSKYTLNRLLGSEKEAKEFKNGYCLVIRLCADNYHRYSFVDDCEIKSVKFIKGVLHTVRPVALDNTPVFTENCREITYMETKHFGTVAQIEIGAMLVGKISNHYSSGAHKRSEEKGMFLYGGSTVILLFSENEVDIPDRLMKYTADGFEVPVKQGEKIGVTKNA